VPHHATSTLIIALIAATSAGCLRQDDQLRQHREKLASLEASATAIGESWLAGRASGTFTTTALEQTFHLVENERSAVASAPAALLDPRGAELSQSAERLSRLLAAMMRDVRAADPSAVRQQMTTIAAIRAEPK
jgi:hypothetical protein